MQIAEIREKIAESKVISIDMDGVLISLFLNRVWFEAPYRHTHSKEKAISYLSYLGPIIHLFGVITKGSSNCIKQVNDRTQIT